MLALDSSIRQLSREHERYTDDRLNNIRRAPISSDPADLNHSIQAKKTTQLARKNPTLRVHARQNADLFCIDY